MALGKDSLFRRLRSPLAKTGGPPVVCQEDGGLAEGVPVEMVHDTATQEVADEESR